MDIYSYIEEALLMFIDLFKNDGIDYLRLAQSYRSKNCKGKAMPKKRRGRTLKTDLFTRVINSSTKAEW